MSDSSSPKRRRAFRIIGGVLGVLVLLAAVAGVGAYRFFAALDSIHRDESSPDGLREVASVERTDSLVVAANPEAVALGRQVLDAGGSALDAAVAVQLGLGLVEPDCSGIAGGAFLLYWDAEKRELRAYDGRERAPMSADAGYLLDASGEPMRFDRALIGGRSVGVPGVMRMLERAHREHGRLPWSSLFDGAIALAEGGFEVTGRLHGLVAADPILPTMPRARAYFFDEEGEAWPVGHRLENPAYAGVLRALRDEGADALHRGPIAEEILAAVHGARQPTTARLLFNVVWRGLGGAGGGEASEPASGELTAADLEAYTPAVREPLCRRYRSYRVCAFGPPTSGGVAVLQILGLLERFELSALEPTSTEAMHLYADAQRLAFLDRNRWLGDPDAVDVPVEGLLDPGYLEERGQNLDRNAAFSGLVAGTPPGARVTHVPRPSPEQPSTSHLSIVDAHGNAVSMTTSIEAPFGSHVMVRGMLLNNQLTDFSFASEEDGRVVANAPGPGKRPRSSMSPVLIFDGETGDLRFVVGSPGGSRIISYVAQTTLALIDWGLTPQEAVELPHVVARGPEVEVDELGWEDPVARDELVAGLEALGHEVAVTQLISGLHVIAVQDGRLVSGADPRRDGSAG